MLAFNLLLGHTPSKLNDILEYPYLFIDEPCCVVFFLLFFLRYSTGYVIDMGLSYCCWRGAEYALQYFPTTTFLSCFNYQMIRAKSPRNALNLFLRVHTLPKS